MASAAVTDEPVLRSGLWHALRAIEFGTWNLGEFTRDHKLVRVHRCVVDDYGQLQALTPEGDMANAIWHASHLDGADVAAQDWLCEQVYHASHASNTQRLAKRTRDLLRPPPVTVEVITEPADTLCVASLIVGPDPRLDAPLYSVHVDRETPLLLTHAQLCALMLGAQQLVKAAIPRGRLQ